MSTVQLNATTLDPWTGGNGLTSLDAESMVVYCQAQLGEVDTQVASLTRQQELAITRKKAVATLENAYAAIANGSAKKDDLAAAYTQAIESLPPGDPLRAELDRRRIAAGCYTQAETEVAVNEAMREASEKCDAIVERTSPFRGAVVPAGEREAQIAALYQQKIADAANRTRAEMAARAPSKEQAETAKLELKTMSDEIGGDAEINMIRLQSLVSSRQTMVSLVTNLLAKLQSGEKSIVDNIR